MNHFISLFADPLVPLLLQAISAILGVLLIRLTSIVKERWGIEIEATHREALHAAIMSGIRAALSRGETGHDAISSALTHAAKSVPDAIFALNPESGVLASIAEAKLREVLDSGSFFGLDLSNEAQVGAS